MKRFVAFMARAGERVSVVMVTLGTALAYPWPGPGQTMLVIGCLVGGSGFAADVRVRRQGRRRLIELRALTGLDAVLFDLGDAMHLPAPWRLSLYSTRPDDEDSTWHRIARASSADMYQRGGRATIPRGEGVLWLAEQTGAVDELRGVPDRQIDEPAFLHFHASRNVPPQVALQFRMPSCAYVAVVHRFHAAGGSGEQVSVGLVAETANRVREGELRVQLVERVANRVLLRSLHRAHQLDEQLGMISITEVAT